MKTIIAVLIATAALAAPPDQWLHVKVEGSGNEKVRVNIPLSMVEKVLPALHVDRLRDGRLHIEKQDMNVDLHQLFDALKTSPDNEFVSVQNDKEDVRVAKSKGNLVVRVRDGKGSKHENVDVTIPMPVVEALLSGGKDELNLLAGIRALSAQGDITLVTVTDNRESVRVWIDSKNRAD